MNWIELAQSHPVITFLTTVLTAGAAGFAFAEMMNRKKLEFLNEKVSLYTEKIEHFNQQIGGLKSNVQELKSASTQENFSGVWDLSWGHLMFEQRGDHGVGLFLDRNGKSYFLKGNVRGETLEFGWTRYEGNRVESEGTGRFSIDLAAGTLDGVWQDAQGVGIANTAKRFSWD